MNTFIKPKKITIDDKDFVISKLPYRIGRDILLRESAATQGQTARLEGLPSILEWTARLLPDGTELQLTTDALIENHCGEVSVALELEAEMLEYNGGFLPAVSRWQALGKMDRLVSCATKMQIPLPPQLSAPALPGGGNSTTS